MNNYHNAETRKKITRRFNFSILSYGCKVLCQGKQQKEKKKKKKT